MTLETDIPQPDICTIAHQKIMSVIDGNGAKANDVTINIQNQATLNIQGYLKIIPIADTKEEITSGRSQKGVEHPSQGEKTASIKDITDMFPKEPAVQSEVLQKVEKQPGLGWGLQNQELDIEHEKHILFHTENCQACDAHTKVDCHSCRARGEDVCNTCLGNGRITCMACDGMRDIMQHDGSEKPCIKCQQRGTILCTTCRGQKRITCPTCQGRKTISCQQCKATGIQSVLSYLQFRISTQFRADLGEECPEDIKDIIINQIDVDKLSIDKYIQITDVIADTNEKEELVLNYTATLPIASVEFSIAGKLYPAVIIGYNAAVFQCEDFLDHLIKPGISALHKLTKGPMAADALLKKAQKFKILNFALKTASRTSKKKLFAKIKSDYPIGLSDKYIKAIIINTRKALKKITTKPRYIGFGLGSVLGAALCAGWFLTGVRQSVIQKIPNIPIIAFDSGTVLIACLLIYFIAKVFVNKKIASLLN